MFYSYEHQHINLYLLQKSIEIESGIEDQKNLYIYACRVVTVPKFQYSVPIPVKIHGSRYQFRYQSKTQKYAN